MTYHPGITFTGVSTDSRKVSDRNEVRKAAYKIFAVFAFMAAAAIVVSAYHPTDGNVSNPRFDSMGVSHVPTAFRGAPPINHGN